MNRTITYEQFKTRYYKIFPNSTYRLGQYFLSVFIKDTEKHWELWEERCPHKQNNLIWKIILDYNWDCNKLIVIKEDLL